MDLVANLVRGVSRERKAPRAKWAHRDRKEPNRENQVIPDVTVLLESLDRVVHQVKTANRVSVVRKEIRVDLVLKVLQVYLALLVRLVKLVERDLKVHLVYKAALDHPAFQVKMELQV